MPPIEMEDCCQQAQACTPPSYRKMHGQPTRLFVIKQRGREVYWNCSTEHGAGWNPHHPKQSFSPSELTREIRRMIDDGHFTDVEVLSLYLA